MSLGGGLFCRCCGAYAFQQLELLGDECRGRLCGGSSGPAAWRLKRLHEGRHPKTGVYLGTPSRIDPALAASSAVLGDNV